MTAPRSNFTVPTSSGWFIINGPSGYQTAKMNGATFISALERALRTAPQLVNPVHTFDGTMVQGSDVREGDRQWGPTVYRAMWAVAQARGAMSTTLLAIQLAAQARTINLATMTAAAQIVMTSLGHMSPGPRFPANSLLPVYNVAMPGIVTIIDIVDSTSDEMVAVGITPTSPTGTGTPVNPPPPTDPVTGLPTDDTGGKTDSGAPPDSGTGGKTANDEGGGIRLPTGQPDTAITAHGISWGPIVAVGAGIVALGALAYSLSGSSEPVRHNPPMHGPRMPRMYLEREHLDAGGYTKQGRYFGIGLPLYRCTGDNIIDLHGHVVEYVDNWLRAPNRAAAMAKIRERYPNVRFAGKE